MQNISFNALVVLPNGRNTIGEIWQFDKGTKFTVTQQGIFALQQEAVDDQWIILKGEDGAPIYQGLPAEDPDDPEGTKFLEANSPIYKMYYQQETMEK